MSAPLDETGTVLLAIARGSLHESLGGPALTFPDGAWLREPGATFVTLTNGGALRGCIGSLEARRPLCEDVRENAKAAAFHDPRFPPLLEVELKDTRVEVTLLSKLEPVEAETEEEAIARLRPGVDGVLMTWGWHRGVFIPQMWERLPDARTFLRYLKQKANLPADGWLEGTRLQRFTAKCWEEP